MGLIDVLLIVILIVICVAVFCVLSTIIFIVHGGSGSPWNTLLYRINPYKPDTLPYKDTALKTNYPSSVSRIFRIIGGVLVGLLILFMGTTGILGSASGKPMYEINPSLRFYVFCALVLLTALVFVVIWLIERKPNK